MVVFRDDDQYVAYCPDLDLATAQDSPEAAIENIILAIREYVKDYLKNFKTYSESPNREQYFPLVQHIAGPQRRLGTDEDYRGQIWR